MSLITDVLNPEYDLIHGAVLSFGTEHAMQIVIALFVDSDSLMQI